VFYRRGLQAEGRVSFLKSSKPVGPFVSDHRVEWADICGYLKSRKRGMFCKKENFVNSHGSGDLVNYGLGTFCRPCGGQGPNTYLSQTFLVFSN
jgi:hypothetical protein